jgi:hypothetical protein
LLPKDEGHGGDKAHRERDDFFAHCFVFFELTMSFLEKENHNELSRVIIYPSLIFYNPCFLPESCWFILIRQVFWLVLLKVILPKLLQWI